MAKLHIIAPYPKGEAPSQRFRFEQYLDFLEENGVEIQYHSFHTQRSWKRLYRPGSFLIKGCELLFNFFRRWILLFQLIPAKHILIHREMAHIGPPVFEWILAKVLRKKYTLDFDDAIWIPNFSSANARFQRLKAYWKVKHIIRWSEDVTAGNRFLADYAEQFSQNVRIVPTTIDTTKQHNILVDHTKKPIVIGWTGTHSTMRYLDFIVPILQKLETEFEFEFLVISNQKPDYDLKSLRYKDWELETEISDLAQIHIGIMPLISDQWSEGKCGFKALQYMSLGMASIVSPVGVNTTIIQDGENGFIANSPEEWKNALRKLLTAQELRERIGKSARKTIEEKWSVERWKHQYLMLIENVKLKNESKQSF
jgi:glycosyltransferase involved in cell wall biosynthesis